MIEWTIDEHKAITIKIWDQQLIDDLPNEARKAKNYFLAWALDEARKLASDLSQPDYKETRDVPFSADGRLMVLQTMEVIIKGKAK